MVRPKYENSPYSLIVRLKNGMNVKEIDIFTKQ